MESGRPIAGRSFNMKPIEEFLKDMLLPKSIDEVTRWARYYYDIDPAINNFVDAMYISFGRKPTDDEIRGAVSPFFKLLLYRDYCRENLVRKIE